MHRVMRNRKTRVYQNGFVIFFTLFKIFYVAVRIAQLDGARHHVRMNSFDKNKIKGKEEKKNYNLCSGKHFMPNSFKEKIPTPPRKGVKISFALLRSGPLIRDDAY